VAFSPDGNRLAAGSHRDEEDRFVAALAAVAQELVADALLFEEGNQPGPQERGLAHAALAVQHQDAAVRLVQEQGEALHVGVAPGEQRPVLAVVVGQRPIGMLGQRRHGLGLRSQ